jgi:hypothetical protein
MATEKQLENIAKAQAARKANIEARKLAKGDVLNLPKLPEVPVNYEFAPMGNAIVESSNIEAIWGNAVCSAIISTEAKHASHLPTAFAIADEVVAAYKRKFNK